MENENVPLKIFWATVYQKNGDNKEGHTRVCLLHGLCCMVFLGIGYGKSGCVPPMLGLPFLESLLFLAPVLGG